MSSTKIGINHGAIWPDDDDDDDYKSLIEASDKMYTDPLTYQKLRESMLEERLASLPKEIRKLVARRRKKFV